MNEIIKSISKLIPFEKWGLKREIAEPLSIIVLVVLGAALGVLSKYIIKRYKSIADMLEEVAPQFDYLSLKKARKYYIPTQFQNASPSRQEEPGFTHQYIARNRLIPFFLKRVFNQKIESERFYLILADSGMGKTTFMINLFLKYNNFFNTRYKKAIKLLRFADPDTFDIIKSMDVEKARRTILLLDGLDEDPGIVSQDPAISDDRAFRDRVDEIIEITKSFADIIITCRTQYFPGQEDDPYELKIRRPDEKGFYTLNKIYISPLNDKEVRCYLNKKYGWIGFVNYKKKKKALKVVSQAENLVVRPMLLSYIDYLIEEPGTYKNIYTVYDALVRKWLKREAEKRKGANQQEVFIKNLENLSQSLAVAIYYAWKNKNRLYLSKDETLRVARKFNIKLDPQEITGQSLLTCDGSGNWKFAHKSIMEFFLAKEIYKKPGMLKDFNFVGMDMAKTFYYKCGARPVFIERRILDDVYNSYVCSTCVVDEEFKFESEAYAACTLLQAVEYCNRLNVENGYSRVYDKNGSFLNSTGTLETKVENIRGFRLPTMDEWEYMFHDMSELSAKRNAKNQFIKARVSVNSNPSDILKESLEYKIINEGEWCIDVEGAHVVKLLFSETKEPARGVGLEMRVSKKMSAGKFSNYRSTNERHAFRVVFIP